MGGASNSVVSVWRSGDGVMVSWCHGASCNEMACDTVDNLAKHKQNFLLRRRILLLAS
jgi:hypothetical protein